MFSGDRERVHWEQMGYLAQKTNRGNNLAKNYKDDKRLFLKISGKMDSPSLNYWPLNMIFLFAYFEKSHHIQVQYGYKSKILGILYPNQHSSTIWLQIKISGSLYTIQHLLKAGKSHH